jgi:hypothetical protein
MRREGNKLFNYFDYGIKSVSLLKNALIRTVYCILGGMISDRFVVKAFNDTGVSDRHFYRIDGRVRVISYNACV